MYVCQYKSLIFYCLLFQSLDWSYVLKDLVKKIDIITYLIQGMDKKMIPPSLIST